MTYFRTWVYIFESAKKYILNQNQGSEFDPSAITNMIMCLIKYVMDESWRMYRSDPYSTNLPINPIRVINETRGPVSCNGDTRCSFSYKKSRQLWFVGASRFTEHPEDYFFIFQVLEKYWFVQGEGVINCYTRSEIFYPGVFINKFLYLDCTFKSWSFQHLYDAKS